MLSKWLEMEPNGDFAPAAARARRAPRHCRAADERDELAPM
jgi:hypothetical protein